MIGAHLFRLEVRVMYYSHVTGHDKIWWGVTNVEYFEGQRSTVYAISKA